MELTSKGGDSRTSRWISEASSTSGGLRSKFSRAGLKTAGWMSVSSIAFRLRPSYCFARLQEHRGALIDGTGSNR